MTPLRFVVKVKIEVRCSGPECTAEADLDGLPVKVDTGGLMLLDWETLDVVLRSAHWVAGQLSFAAPKLLVPGVDRPPQIPPLILALCPKCKGLVSKPA